MFNPQSRYVIDCDCGADIESHKSTGYCRQCGIAFEIHREVADVACPCEECSK